VYFVDGFKRLIGALLCNCGYYWEHDGLLMEEIQFANNRDY